MLKKLLTVASQCVRPASDIASRDLRSRWQLNKCWEFSMMRCISEASNHAGRLGHASVAGDRRELTIVIHKRITNPCCLMACHEGSQYG